ncbi:Dynein heavy chain family protein [Trichomonas vaginalis G3]|uniref:Dynein heavy chain family protein n=1 Tax=Trichomonas vaginalis (strain ATCC PRA-98 / G3) TaxID=412133 RepID=A2DP34_TRIV3|nr:dynein heavy chain family protein family [Trichomonas vaginalis G3]EAY17883.1 Dynein heavy chain family protein [Trichomonas vaginalis G3]KAI5489899.1 dynein heavy chain family protein family [Trichomonas vaginalis G3]|eukprot:XP_001330018.1 Dynein heavy chain family protein [Trichomonas vaginalis G3]
MTFPGPSNIPNKHSKELLGRLVPKQAIHNHPVTFNSTLSKNHPQLKSPLIQLRQKVLPPLQVTADQPIPIESEPQKIPYTKDPIEYIQRAKAGTDTREYVYLEPANIIEDSEHPTCLRIIPASQMKDSNFWTLSLKGLTHFNRPVVDFIPLEQWLRENDLFSRIMTIPFFKYQRQWRHFKTWHRNILKKKQSNAQLGLTTNLFFANPTLRPAFIKIQQELGNLRKLKIITINPKKTYTLGAFVEENARNHKELKENLDQFFNNIVGIMATACEKSMDTGSHDRDKDQESQSPLNQLIAQYEKQQKNIDSKSTYDVATSNKYTNKAVHNALCQMVVRFVRMIDYLIVNNLREICNSSLLELFTVLSYRFQAGSELLGYDNSDFKDLDIPFEWKNIYENMKATAQSTFSKPVLSVEGIYEKGFVWQPTFDEVINQISSIRTGVVKLLCSIPRMIHNPVFKQYISSAIELGPTQQKKLSTPDVNHILPNDPLYKMVIEHIKVLIQNTFKLLDFFKKNFNQAIQIYEKNLKFDVSFLDKETVNASEIRSAIKELKDQEDFISKIEEVYDTGLYECNISGMKELFMKSPSKCLNEIQRALKTISHKFLVKYNERVREAYHELSLQTDNVGQFVGYLNAVKKNQETVRELYNLSDAIRDMHLLANENGGQIPQDEINMFSELTPIFDSVKRSLSYADDNRQILQPRFQSMLDKSCAALHARVIEVVLLSNNEKLSNLQTTPDEALDILKSIVEQTEEIYKSSQEYNQYQSAMMIPLTDFDDVMHLFVNVNLKKLLWDTKKEWSQKTEEWCNTSFQSVDPDKMVLEIQDFVTKASTVSQGLPENNVAQDLKKKVDYFAAMVPIISDLKNPALKQSHTEQIEKLLGDTFFNDPQFVFGKLVDLKAYLYVDKIRTISEQATNEQALLDQLNNMKNAIEQLQFTPVPLKNHKNAYYLEGIEQIQNAIDDSKSILNSIRASKFVAQHRARAEEWIKYINTFESAISTVDNCQKNFVFISEIFQNSELARQLSAESRDLSAVEKSWKSFSQRASDDPLAFKLCNTGNIINDLVLANQSLDQIYKSIESFLEQKRQTFPRLYLLSNTELINLISKMKDHQALIPYLPKLFTGIQTVEFIMESHIPSIAFALNDLGERISLRPVKFHTNIENWLLGLCEAMQRTVKTDIRNAQQKHHDMIREDWVQVCTIQCALVATHLERTRTIEEALSSQNPNQSLIEVLNGIKQDIQNMTKFTHLDLHPVEKNKIESLMLNDIFYMDLVQDLIDKQITSVSDPFWTQQLTYRRDENSKDLIVTQNFENFEYGYEYIGKSTKFITTPLVFESFTSLFNIIKGGYHAAIIGQSNTGKTNMFLAMAEMLGCFAAVRPCERDITTQQIMSYIKGAATGGYWLCLEGFSDLDRDVISAVSEQYQSISIAKIEQQKKYESDGTDIQFNQNCGLFITCNDSKTYYEKLPENLKETLRPVNIYEPDVTSISENLLYVFGFANTSSLADSINGFFKHASAIVSEQSRPLFTLRNIINCIIESKKVASQMVSNETTYVAKAIANIMMPLLPNYDQQLILPLINDEFGFLPEILEAQDEISIHLDTAFVKAQLKMNDYQIQKVVQLQLCSLNKKGIIIVGDPRSGKSSIIKLLEEARTIISETNEAYLQIEKTMISPGKFTQKELFGCIDEEGKWFDGVIGTVLNQVPILNNKEQWVVFEGDLDQSWTDQICTAFDFNHKISFGSSSTYIVPNTMRFVFETNDLSKASPALLSRCSIVNVSAKEFGTNSFVNAALEERVYPLFNDKKKLIQRIDECVKATINPGVDFINELCGLYSPFNMIDTFFSFFTTLLKGLEIPDSHEGQTIISSLFAYSFLWSYGGFLSNSLRIQFESFVRDSMSNLADFPNRGILFDYSVNTANGTWSNWLEQVPHFGINDQSEVTMTMEDIRSNNCFVQTTETVRISTIMKHMLSAHRHVILTGDPCSGKTELVKYCVSSLENEGETNTTITFSPLTTGKEASTMIANCFERISGKYLQPHGRTQSVIVIDKANSPTATQPLEIIRSIFNGTGIRLLPNYKLYPTKNVSIICIADNTSPIKHSISANVYTLNYTKPDTAVLTTIISSIYQVYFAKFDEFVRTNISKVSNALCLFYERLVQNIPKKDGHPHYTFSLHDLFRSISGVFYTHHKSLSNSDSFIRLIYSEIFRVFGDRIIDQVDRKHFDEAVLYSIKSKIGVDMNLDTINQTFFCDLNISNSDNLKQSYTEYKEEEIIENLQNIINEFNNAKRMQSETILPLRASGIHLARMIKVLKRPFGHMVLYGGVGTGKTTVSRLGVFVAGADTIYATSNNETDDIKNSVIKAGVTGKKVVLVVREKQLKNEKFSNNLSILMGGGDPLMFLSSEEVDKGCNELVFTAKQIGENESIITLRNMYRRRVWQYLHVMILLDNLTPKLLENYPSISQASVFDYYEPLPDDSLKAIASASFAEMPDQDKIVDAAVFVHHTAMDIAQKMLQRENKIYIITPSLFVTFLSTFIHLVKKRTDENNSQSKNLQEGVDKLKYISDFLQTTEVQLVDQKPRYESMCQEADQLLHYINENEVTYEKLAQRLRYEEKNVKNKLDEIEKLNNEMKQEYLSVEPQLANAIAQLKGLNRGDIMDLRSFGEPPLVVKTVMEVICILAEVDVSWKSAVQLLSDSTFISRISSKYSDQSHVPQDILAKIKPYVESNPNFQESEVGRVSVAAKSLCMWATSLYNYEVTYNNLQPKERQIRNKQNAVQNDQEVLEKRRNDVKKLSDTIEELKNRCDAANKEKRKLSEGITTAKNRMAHAKRILQILSEDNATWKRNKDQNDVLAQSIVADSFVCASFLVYLGPMTSNFRDSAYNMILNYLNEHGFKLSGFFSFVRSMVSSSTVRDWIAFGLPDDRVCIESATIIMNSERTPFILDSTGIASKFIQNCENQRQIAVVRPTTHNLMRTIESSIRLGVPILMEDVESSFDANLENLTTRRTFKQDNKTYVKLGDKAAECEESYKLYMTVPLVENPSPQAFTKTTVVEFEISKEAFAKQELLHIADIVNPTLSKDIKNAREKIICEEKIIKQINDKILETIRTIGKDQILDDEILITTLEGNKQTLSESTKTLGQTQTLFDKLVEQRGQYLPIANRVALISNAASQLYSRNASYRFSNAFIRHVVDSTLSASDKIEDIIPKVTYALFISISRAMKYNHQLEFALSVATDLSITERRLTQEELNVFLKRPSPVPTIESPPVKEMSQKTWGRILALANTLPALKHIGETLKISAHQLEDWYKSHSVTIPSCISEGLTEFQCLLLQRELNQQNFESVMRIYIEHTLGKEYAKPVKFDLESAMKIAGPLTPIIITLHGRVTPRRYIQKLSKGHNLQVRSLGNGQLLSAEKALNYAMQRGDWLLLENSESMPDFIEEVDNAIAKGGAHQNFLLFISATDVSSFPLRLLNLAAKVALESPNTTKGIIQNCLESLPQDFFQGAACCRLSLSLALAHATIAQRTNYEKVTFAENCNFSLADFTFASNIIKPYLQEPTSFSISSTKNAFELCYGGHSSFKQDSNTIRAIFERVMSTENLVPESPILGIETSYAPPKSYAELLDLLSHTSDEDSPEIIGLPKISRKKSPIVVSREIPFSERGVFFYSLIKKLPELDQITVSDPPRTDPLGAVFERDALREQTAIQLVRQCPYKTPLSLLKGDLPEEWTSVLPWPGPLENWMARLNYAAETYNQWSRMARPAVIDISSLADPKAYISALILKFCRMNSSMPHTCYMMLKVPDNKEAPADVGANVSGLLLVGARWDEESSCIEDVNDQIVNPLPVMHLKPVKQLPPGTISIPIYSESNGVKQLVAKIPIQAAKTESFWAQRCCHIIFGHI